MFGDAQPSLPRGTGKPGGDVQQPVAQLLGLRGGEVTIEEQQVRPGEQVDAGEGELQPGGVDREQAGGESAEAGVLAATDAVLDAGVAAVPARY